MLKRFTILLLFSLLLIGCCVNVRLPPQISNSMGWSRGTLVKFHGDVDFDQMERVTISQACMDWAAFTGAGIVCTVSWDRDFIERPYRGDADDYSIIKTDGKDLSMLIFMAGNIVEPSNILGYAPHSWNLLTGDRTAAIFLAVDNIRPPLEEGELEYKSILRAVAKHEMGHVFGFEHIDQHRYRPNIMHANIDRASDPFGTVTGEFGEDDLAQCLRIGLCR